ncbi:MAG: hypothetical protein GEU93_11205 [Propionibacteriales bacterium]|nr:hypothetical protein [Propionibacteriales bacterium]
MRSVWSRESGECWRADVKRCSKCRVAKLVEDFSRNRAMRDGRQNQCRGCQRANRQANAERLRKQRHEYYQANAERIRESQREYHKANLERIREYRQANAERIRNQRHEYYQANAERIREQKRRWYQVNPERRREYDREWRQGNPEKVRAQVQRRRARKLAAYVEDVDPAAILVRDNGECQICVLLVFTGETDGYHELAPHIDHVIPLDPAHGGTHEPANVRLAHAYCNIVKGTGTDADVPGSLAAVRAASSGE